MVDSGKILAFAIMVAIAIPAVKGGIKCHYCGVKEKCELPFDVKAPENEFITCEKSCMKFDGFAKDGHRVVVRDCGIFETDECDIEREYQNTGAKGTMCHCTSNECNLAARINPASSLLFFATTSVLLKCFF